MKPGDLLRHYVPDPQDPNECLSIPVEVIKVHRSDIWAIVRGYNTPDAHPFIIHVPTDWEPAQGRKISRGSLRKIFKYLTNKPNFVDFMSTYDMDRIRKVTPILLRLIDDSTMEEANIELSKMFVTGSWSLHRPIKNIEEILTTEGIMRVESVYTTPALAVVILPNPGGMSHYIIHRATKKALHPNGVGRDLAVELTDYIVAHHGLGPILLHPDQYAVRDEMAKRYPLFPNFVESFLAGEPSNFYLSLLNVKKRRNL